MTTDYAPLNIAAFEGHSPEPWEIASVFMYEPRCAICSGRQHIADIVRGPRPNGDDARVPRRSEAEANAHLIEAAPQLLRERNELLAALKDITKELGAVVGDDMPTPFTEARGAVVDSCSALIARIEGQQ